MVTCTLWRLTHDTLLIKEGETMNKRTVTRFCIGIVGIIFSLLLVSSISYAIPQTINYQGYLTDSGGYPLDGTVNIVFSLL